MPEPPKKVLFAHTPKAGVLHLIAYFERELHYQRIQPTNQTEDGVWLDFTIDQLVENPGANHAFRDLDGDRGADRNVSQHGDLPGGAAGSERLKPGPLWMLLSAPGEGHGCRWLMNRRGDSRVGQRHHD